MAYSNLEWLLAGLLKCGVADISFLIEKLEALEKLDDSFDIYNYLTSQQKGVDFHEVLDVIYQNIKNVYVDMLVRGNFKYREVAITALDDSGIYYNFLDSSCDGLMGRLEDADFPYDYKTVCEVVMEYLTEEGLINAVEG